MKSTFASKWKFKSVDEVFKTKLTSASSDSVGAGVADWGVASPE